MIQKILKFLIYSTILLMPFYLVRFSIFQIPTNPVEILIGLAFTIWATQLRQPSPIFKLPKIYWLSFLLIFSGLTISTLLNPNLIQELGIIKGWFIFPFLFFLIILDQINSPEKRNQLLKLLFVSSAFVGVISLTYLLSGQLTFDGRLKAFYLSPNHLAMFLIPGIIIGFFSVARIISLKKRFDVSFYFPLMGSIFMLISLYFTFSYGAWIALFSALLFSLGLTDLLSQTQKVKIFIALFFLILIAFSFQLSNKKLAGLFQSDPRSSFSSRTMIWTSAWKIGQNHLIWGIGPGNFQEKYLEYQKYFPPYLEWAVPQPHNLYLAFWLQGGLLGLLGFLFLVGAWIVQLLHSLKNKRGVFSETAFLAIILSILIHGLIDTPYWKNDLALLFWIIASIGISFMNENKSTTSNG